MAESVPTTLPPETRLVAVDVGSTIVKIASVDETGKVTSQQFFERDFERGILKQISQLFERLRIDASSPAVAICSSANGGLRVGILCLTQSISGAVLRNQALLAGANPLFVKSLNDSVVDPQTIDVLLVGGGIDCADIAPLAKQIKQISPGEYAPNSIIYCGNKYARPLISELYPEARFIDNPCATAIDKVENTVFVALRNAYLEDLIYKEGVSELAKRFSCSVRPTPEVVSHGFYKAVSNLVDRGISGTSVMMDIGGATTDLHYTVEIVRDDSPNRPAFSSSIARYVFSDLGVSASIDSTVLQLRRNPRTFEFLNCVLSSGINDYYRLLREGEKEPDAEIAAYACIFLALDRFTTGNGPGLPTADLGRLERLVLTGGASQSLDTAVVARLVGLFTPTSFDSAAVSIDNEYRFWIDGIR